MRFVRPGLRRAWLAVVTTVYRLRKSHHRPRVSGRAALAVSGLAFAGWVAYGAATVHMPVSQPPAVTVTQDAPAPAAAPATQATPKATSSGHPLLASAGSLVARHTLRGLVPHPYLRHRSLGWWLWRKATR